MFDDVSESAFPEFLAAFWAEKGWDTSVTENDDGTYLVAGDKDGGGTRGLIGVRPDADVEIGAGEVEDFAAFCDRKGVDVRVMATRGRFTTGARSAADAGDVHLLDQNELASSVREEGVEDLVEEYRDGGDGSVFDALPALPVSVPAGLPSGVPVVPLLAAIVVVAAATFAGPTIVGVVPFIGGGGGGGGDAGVPITAVSLADSNGTAATVRWDARLQDTVNGGNYTSGQNHTFVVVQFNATAGGEAATLRAEHFVLAANGTNYAVAEFANVTRSFRAKQLPKRVPANGSARAVLIYRVPAGVDGATLVETYDGPGVRFVRADLAFDGTE
ncbi:MAG: restriction endonuclease [Halobacterium sp.]